LRTSPLVVASIDPLLILVPGLACDASVWAPLLPALSTQVKAWAPAEAVQHSVTEMAQALLRDAPAERFDLAGHSFGGRIALEVLRLAPERVQRLALLDTGYQPLAAGANGETEVQQRLALVEWAQREGMRAMAERWAPPMVHPDRLGTPLYTAVLDMVARQSLERFAAQQQALIHRPDATAVLASIRCPTLVLCGCEDHWSPLARHEDMAARVPGSVLVAVPHCGHMSTMEQPQAVAAALQAWLQQPV
jgi:pimeloyl-ACP methyl ester carboxylesterase